MKHNLRYDDDGTLDMDQFPDRDIDALARRRLTRYFQQAIGSVSAVRYVGGDEDPTDLQGG